MSGKPTSFGTQSTQKSNTVFIIVIVILVILLIGIPILVWYLTNRSKKPGVGGKCTISTDCATGLVCSSGLCKLPDCIDPAAITGIANDDTINGLTWDVELSWTADPNADSYIIYIGGTAGFDINESIFTQIETDTSHLFENVPPSTDVYVRIRGVSDECGFGPLSNEYSFTTGDIL